MTIEEAIQHCYEVANGKDNQCDECRKEHLQIAKWLEENTELKRLLKIAVEDLHKFGESVLTCFLRIVHVTVIINANGNIMTKP